MKKLLSLVVALALMLAALPALAEYEEYLGKPMPDFTVTDTEGNSLSLSTLLAEKELVVLNVFASWCGPCRVEFPEMETVYESLSDRMEIVAVSGYPGDTDEILADYRAELGLGFPMGSATGTGILSVIPLEGYPTSVFIDRNGNIGYVQLGMFTSGAAFESAVRYFLDAGNTESPTVYQVYVCDGDGVAVPDVYVNFCTDTACLPSKSDAYGLITLFSAPEEYHLQVLAAPEGYGFDEDYEAVIGPDIPFAVIELTGE